MGNRDIYFYEESETIEISCTIPMACTDKFFTRCEQYRFSADAFLTNLSKQQVLLVRKAKYKDKHEEGCHLLTILTIKGVLLCSLKSDGQLLIIDLFEKNIREQNKYLKNSLKIYTTEGISISYINRMTDSVEVWGGTSNDLHIQSAIFKKYVSEIRTQVEGLEDRSTPDSSEEDEQEETLSDELEELLDIAENYVIAEDEIQRSNAQSGPIINYFKFEANSNAAREERVSYVFTAFDYDQQLYKRGTRVEVELLDEKVMAGAIIDTGDDDEEEAEEFKITILFDEVFSVHELPLTGIIKLEYNSVQRNVREGVIEELRELDGLATYFDPLIGRNKSAGFEKQDLSPLDDTLNQQKYPPNDSQKEAIFRGVNVRDGMLVLGPPGTGKTTVILQWVKYFVEQENKRVLISSQNNKAVDNVLERLSKEKTIDTIRVGKEDKIQANVQHLMFESRSYELQQRITKSTTNFHNYIVESDEILSEYRERLSHLNELAVSLKEVDGYLSDKYGTIQKLIKPVASLYEEYLQVSEQVKQTQVDIEEKSQHVAGFDQVQGFKTWVKWPQKKWNQLRIKQLYKKWENLTNEEAGVIWKYEDKVKEMDQLLSDEEFINQKEFKVSTERAWNQSRDSLYKVPSVPLSHLTLPGLAETDDFTTNVKDLNRALELVEERMAKLSVMQRSLTRWTGYLQDKKNYALSKILLESVDLVGATCIGINSNQRFQDVEFDVTIIDEAGQIKIQDAIVPMSRSPKFIMLGDHKQIPPIEDQEVIERVEEIGVDTSFQSKSFFEYLYDRFPKENKILLDTQYRMPEKIANLLSEWFYEGEYKTFIGKQNVVSPLPHLFNKPFAIIDTSKEYHRLESRVPGQGYYNEYEARVVVQLLKKILREAATKEDDHTPRFSFEDIGIITPYGKQVQYMRDLVAKEIPELTKKEIAQMVASLDSFQGQERPIIIYSCTRSNLKPVDQPRIGFLKELRRLNVALSRCQEQLIFIGDMDFLSSCNFKDGDSDESEFAAFIQLMLQHAEQGNGHKVQSKLFLRTLKNDKQIERV